MYEDYYGFREKPFSRTPDPRFLYQSRKHAEALARLQLAVEEQDIILLTGEIGCGKTTLSRALIDSLDERYYPVLIINPRLSPSQLLGMVARRLGIADENRGKHELLENINGRLYELHAAGKRTTLIIDEAQLIPDKAAFEELRLLTNFQLDDRNLLSLVLLGQPELRLRLSRPPYRALRQRVGLSFHLGPLSGQESKEYVEHRLRVAGREAALFDDKAIGALYRHSEGIPRRINILAGNALLEGFGKGAEIITEEIVEDVASDE
jgi:type II secretory pathway predicted ATPase ExeA